MSNKHVFDCGCSIDIIDGHPQINYTKLNEDCPKAWEIYKKGNTQSIFQLESYLGKKWSKELKPSNIEEAAMLISIIRPGTLQSLNSNGVSLTKVFCDRKRDGWKDEEHFSILDVLLLDTFGINIYQETSMLIAKEIAGFDGSQSMKLIKSIGKKDAELLFSLRKEFLDGCAKVGKVLENEANAIFDNIEASARYAFNKCILGTQKLKQCSKGSHKFHPTIEQLYKITTDIEYAKSTGHLSLYKKHKLNKCFGYALSMDKDGRIRKNKIVNIAEAGVRQCYIITTSSGKTCEVTDNHKFPTPNGDKMVRELSIGDELYICGNYEQTNFNQYKFSNYNISEIRQMRKNGGGKVPHGNFALFNKNRQILQENNKSCQCCLKTSNRYEIHHINKNRADNTLTNLMLLCSSCHKKQEYSSGRVKRGEKGYPSIIEKVVSIEIGSIGMTYDITMEAPNHNYVIDSGIVTCNSHACGYAKAGYWTAWVKAHLPKHYICAWLRNAKSEQKPLEEIRAVISESRRLQINVMPPSINNLPSTNFFVKNDNVYFGLDSIKGCGEKGLAKLIEADINYADCSWTEFLILYSHLVNKTQMINMIRTGCFDYTTIPRIRLEHEYNQYNLLTKSEKSKCLDIFNTDSDYELSTIIGKFIPFCTAKRLPTVKAIHDSIIEKSNIKDDKLNIINHERELLGINVTCTHISRAEIPDVKDSCAAVSKKKPDTELILVGEISDFMEIKIKNPNSKLVGKSMGSFTLTDDRGHTEAIIFPKELEFYQGALYDGNIIMVKCKKSKRDGIIIDKIYEV